MARSLTARVATISFGIELAFACAIPVAYLHLFDIDDAPDRAIVIGLVAVVYALRTGALAAYLAWLLRPIERWMRSSSPDGGLTHRAARAAYDTPLLFAVVWATTWLLYYLPVTAVLRSRFAERIPLTGRALAATILFGLACFSAALPLAYSLLTRQLGPVAGRLSLAARERGLALPGRRVSLRIRLVVLSLSLIMAPTVWLSLTSYMSQVWTSQRDLAARAGQLARALALSAAASAQPSSWDSAARALSTPLDAVAVAAADGSVAAGGAAARELDAAPGLRFRLSRALGQKPQDDIFDPRAERAASYCAIPGTRAVALAISRAPGRDHGGELFDLFFFALIAASWAPVCAVFLAGSIAAPLQRIRSVVSQIVGSEDVVRVGRIPVFHRDEIGDLAHGANEMIDRLHASAESLRRAAAEREQLLAVAARHAAELDAVLDNMVEGVFACDRNGSMTLTNAAGRRLLDLRPSAGARASPGAAGGLQADGRAFRPAELPLLRALAGEVIVEEDEVLENPATHRPVFLRSSAAPIRDAAGAIAGAVVVARDVTEVVDLDRLKDQFIRVAAHELKTPAAILKGYALTLMRTDENLSPSSRRMLEAIDRGAERLNRIVEDLVDVSQAFLDVLQLSPSTVRLDELVRATVAEVPLSSLHHIAIRDGACSATVKADPARTRQALRIILDNAIKYSPSGCTIEVTVSADAEQARVSVRDCGVGIPTEGQERIFRLFYRAHTDTAHDYGGMGIGLYMAKEIVKRQGGHIWFESREGEGSTFSFSLPLAGEDTPS
ncbi:MAG TPA: ATP-binding protein [Myxococcales bacterium]